MSKPGVSAYNKTRGSIIELGYVTESGEHVKLRTIPNDGVSPFALKNMLINIEKAYCVNEGTINTYRFQNKSGETHDKRMTAKQAENHAKKNGLKITHSADSGVDLPKSGAALQSFEVSEAITAVAGIDEALNVDKFNKWHNKLANELNKRGVVVKGGLFKRAHNYAVLAHDAGMSHKEAATAIENGAHLNEGFTGDNRKAVTSLKKNVGKLRAQAGLPPKKPKPKKAQSASFKDRLMEAANPDTSIHTVIHAVHSMMPISADRQSNGEYHPNAVHTHVHRVAAEVKKQYKPNGTTQPHYTGREIEYQVAHHVLRDRGEIGHDISHEVLGGHRKPYSPHHSDQVGSALHRIHTAMWGTGKDAPEHKLTAVMASKVHKKQRDSQYESDAPSLYEETEQLDEGGIKPTNKALKAYAGGKYKKLPSSTLSDYENSAEARAKRRYPGELVKTRDENAGEHRERLKTTGYPGFASLFRGKSARDRLAARKNK